MAELEKANSRCNSQLIPKAVGLGPGPYWSIRSALKGAWAAVDNIG